MQIHVGCKRDFFGGRFRSSVLWVMGPARFHCATPKVLGFSQRAGDAYLCVLICFASALSKAPSRWSPVSHQPPPSLSAARGQLNLACHCPAASACAARPPLAPSRRSRRQSPTAGWPRACAARCVTRERTRAPQHMPSYSVLALFAERGQRIDQHVKRQLVRRAQVEPDTRVDDASFAHVRHHNPSFTHRRRTSSASSCL